MPTFKPARENLLALTNELIDTFNIIGPFLEIGCGDGAISVALARRGWLGLAMDFSDEAVKVTSEALKLAKLQEEVPVIQADFLKLNFDQLFRVVILYDVLEHVSEDRMFLRKIRASLEKGGFLLLSVPIKMKEWRWDDIGYGHLRRYESAELREMLDAPAEGFEMLVQWDISFPVLWAMRRVYMSLFLPPEDQLATTLDARTQESAFTNAGGNSGLVRLVERLPIWRIAFWFQNRFRKRSYGCNTLILARAT